jgi:putative sigma-54 modulation protein
MNIVVQSLGFTAGEDLEAFINEKLKNFDKEINIIRANVTLFIASDANPHKYYCEIRLEIPGNDLFVKKSSDTFEKAIVDAADTIQKNIRKTKEKQLDRNQGNLP